MTSRGTATYASRSVSAPPISPFRLAHDPMERLLILDLEGHERYTSLEIQVFDDDDHGRGCCVLLYRVDEKVDVYRQPGLRLDRARMQAGAGSGEWVETAFSCVLEATPGGASASLDLEDVRGGEVELRLRETDHRGDGLSMLAPLGAGTQRPTFFPFFYMRRIDLVQRRGTELRLRIGGRPIGTTTLPFPMPHTLRTAYLARLCADPLIARLNDAYDGRPAPLELRESGVGADGMAYELDEREGHPEIRRATAAGARHDVHVGFLPAFPDVVGLAEGVRVDGRFQVGTDDIEGVVRGEYSAERSGETVHVTMQPTEDWWPRTGGARVKATLALFPRVFRTWVKEYRWDATIRLGGDVHMRSSWSRRTP